MSSEENTTEIKEEVKTAVELSPEKKVSLKDFKLTPKERGFVLAYLECGGDLTATAIKARPDLYRPGDGWKAKKYGYDLYHRENVENAIIELQNAAISHASIIGKFDNLRFKAEKEETQLKANMALAEITGLIGQKDNAGNAPVVIVQVPVGSMIKSGELIDAEFKEKA